MSRKTKLERAIEALEREKADSIRSFDLAIARLRAQMPVKAETTSADEDATS